MDGFTASAVQAEWICDDKTPRQKARQWRVAFYRNGKLFAVIPVAMTQKAGQSREADENARLLQIQETYIRSHARIEK